MVGLIQFPSLFSLCKLWLNFFVVVEVEFVLEVFYSTISSNYCQTFVNHRELNSMARKQF